MVQQVNLCTAAFRPEVKRFPARTMLPLLGATVVAGSLLGGSWVWNLQRSGAGYRQTLDTQGGEIQSLQAAIQRSRASAKPVDSALVQQLQDKKAAVAQREKVLEVVQKGMLRPGEGHSDRMLLVARSVPAPAWVTSLKIDTGRFELAGFTLEPDALNGWVAQLNASPLMRELKLSSVSVESTAVQGNALAGVPPSAPATAVASGVPTWSFRLLSLEPPAPVLALGKGGTP
jgi:Tfp pilus assembly protein PilN